ncbi:MAG: hypothetical protein ACOX4G_05800 [Limnochordia bacterium]
MKKKLFLVALLGLALIATGCLSRRVDETEAINTVLNEVMQAIVKGDVTYLNTVIVQDVVAEVAREDGMRRMQIGKISLRAFTTLAFGNTRPRS